MATQPPSQFAALLRRSKFASFDPTIAQTYTTFGGHANRGNFGLKRPLPIRFRNATITVGAVDSRQQQTEWKSAEQQKRWMQMWEEVGVTPRLVSSERGLWSAMLGPTERSKWVADSDFTPAPPDLVTEAENMKAEHVEEAENTEQEEKVMMSRAFRNIHAMSEREFQGLLKKLRALRPAFREFLEKTAAKRPQLASQDLWTQSVRPDAQRVVSDFRAHLAWLDYHSQTPTHLEQRPHKFAGLTYTAPTRLQAYLSNEYKPGHIEARNRTGSWNVSFAGMTAELKGAGEVLRHRREGIDWNRLSVTGEYDPTPAVAQLRINAAYFAAPPGIVGRGTQRGLESTTMMVSVATTDAMGEYHGKPNKETPGSPAYVSFQEARSTTTSMLKSPQRAKSNKMDFRPTNNRSASELMAAMGDIIGKNSQHTWTR